MLNKTHILSPNSEFDRRQELTNTLKNNSALSDPEKAILKQCPTEDHECIGLIGCLLKETSMVNKARLSIALLNRFNYELSETADQLLNCTESEFQALIDELAEYFITKDEEITAYENKIFTILFRILQERGY
jgi:hypothetical protein